MELIINSYVRGKGGKRLGILILSNIKCKFHVYYIQWWAQRWEFSGGNFQPHSQMLQPTKPILPNEVSTGRNIDPLSLQSLYLKMLYSEERSGFPWTEPCHRTVFSQIKGLERENNCVMIFGSVNQRFVVVILTLGKRIRVGIRS